MGEASLSDWRESQHRHCRHNPRLGCCLEAIKRFYWSAFDAKYCSQDLSTPTLLSVWLYS